MTTPGSNAPDPERLKNIVARIMERKADIESARGSYMARAKSIREDIQIIFEEADAFGIPKKALKAVIKAQELEAKAEAARDALDEDGQDMFDLIRQSLGDLEDTPLGRAVLRAAGDPDVEDEPEDDGEPEPAAAAPKRRGRKAKATADDTAARLAAEQEAGAAVLAGVGSTSEAIGRTAAAGQEHIRRVNAERDAAALDSLTQH